MLNNCRIQYPGCIYLFKVKNGNTRAMCEICSELTLKTPERPNWSLSCVFIVNCTRISHIFQVFLFLTLNKQLPAGYPVLFVFRWSKLKLMAIISYLCNENLSIIRLKGKSQNWLQENKAHQVSQKTNISYPVSNISKTKFELELEMLISSWV